MALFKIFKGDSGRLETNRPQRQEGFIYLTQDDMKFYIDTQTSTNTTAATLTQAEKEYRQPLNASKADLLQSWETNPADNVGEWTVNIPGITASKLIDGLTIRIRIMTNYNPDHNTLNVNGLGAKLVYFRYETPLTSHLPQYAEMILTYRTAHSVGAVNYTGASPSAQVIGGINYGTDGWVLDSSYSDGNTYDRLLNSAEMRRAGQALSGEKLCMIDENGLLQPVSIGNTTNATKTANTVPLQIPRVIYYAHSASQAAIPAYGIVPQDTLYEDVPFNPQRTINSTIGPYSDLYLVGTINDKGYFVLDNTNATSFYKIVSEPSSSSLANNTFVYGKYYLYIGSSRNADNLVHLMPHNQLYTCLDSNGRQLVAVTPYAITSLGDLGSEFIQTITSGTESGKLTLNGVTKSIYYGRPQAAQWKATDTDLKFEILNTDDSTALSTAMPTLKVAWGGTGTTSLDLNKAIIGNGTNAVKFRDIYTRTSVGTLDWSGATNEYLITKGAIAYWNGAYSGTSSNLAYYKHGAFGTIATANKGEWAKNYLLYTSDTTTADTATGLYSNGTVLGIGVVGVTSGYVLEVGGKAKFNQDALFKKPVVFENTIQVNEAATFKKNVSVAGDLIFPNANKFDWNGDTYRQRLVITDDSVANTAVFTFQQSTNSGSSYTNLMVIDDAGKIIANKFAGDGSELTDLSADHINAGTLAVPYGGTGRKKHAKNSVLFGNDASPIEAATHIKADHTHLSVGQDSVDTNYTFKVNGKSYFSDDITMKSPAAGANSNKIVFTGGTDGADIYYSLPTNNNGILVLNVKDDGEERISFAFKDTLKIYVKPNDSSIYPATTNTGSIGITANRWAHVYVGTADSYGSNTRFIYWSDGVPIQSTANVGSVTKPVYLKAGVFTEVSYELSAAIKAGTANRLAWYKGANEINSAANLYTDASKLSINSTTAPANNGVFQVIGISTMQDILPETTNTYKLGSSSLRWAHLYIGTEDNYGDNTKFIYWNDGVPIPSSANVGGTEQPIYLKAGTFTKTTYALKATVNNGAANRMAYYSAARAISQASSIYASTTAITINGTAAPANSGNFQVIGTSTMRAILPEATNAYALGSSALRWSKLYIGDADSYGDNNKFIYWSDGVPIPSTANVGTAENPVYLKSGTVTKCTYLLSATVESGTTPRLAYYSADKKISSVARINYINNIEKTYNSQKVNQNGLRLWGATYGNTANQLKSNTRGKISYGDGGPQIQFSSTEAEAQDGALIYTDHDACGAGASFHFVSNQTDWNVHSKRFVADSSVTIGDYVPNTSYNLYVGGTTYISSTTYIGGKTTIANQLIAKYDQDFISHGNEFNFVPKLDSDIEVHVNYRQLGSNGSGVISKYHLKNGTNAYSDLYLKSIVGTGTLTMSGTATVNTINSKTLAIWDGNVLKKISPTNLGDTLFRLYTYTASLKLTQEWQDTGITNALDFSTVDSADKKLATGSYIIQVFVNGAGTAGTTNSYSETYTGVMSWYKDACNSTDADEIVLHKAGHASNAHNIYLRTIRQAGSLTLKLQIKCSKTCTANENIVFKLRKMI